MSSCVLRSGSRSESIWDNQAFWDLMRPGAMSLSASKGTCPRSSSDDSDDPLERVRPRSPLAPAERPAPEVTCEDFFATALEEALAALAPVAALALVAALPPVAAPVFFATMNLSLA